MKTKIIKYIIAGLLALLATENPALAESGVPSVGLIYPLSGSFALIGEDCRKGTEIAEQSFGGPKHINFILADSKADPKEGISVFRSLADVEMVIGVFAFRGPVGMAINPISSRSGIPLLGGVGNKEFAAGNKYAFQIWPTSDFEAEFIADTFIKRGLDSAALLSLEDDWTSAVSSAFRSAYARRGGTLAYDQQFAPDLLDFRSELAKVKLSQPKVVFLNLGIVQLGPAIRQYRDLKLTVPLFSNFWIQKKDVLESAGIEAAEGIEFAEMTFDLPSLKKLAKEQYDIEAPSSALLSSYLGTMLLLQASSTSPRTSAELYRSLLEQNEIRTPDRAFKIVERRVQFPLAVKTIRGGRALE